MNRSNGPGDDSSVFIPLWGHQSLRRLLVVRAVMGLLLLGAVVWYSVHAPAGARREWLVAVVVAQAVLLLVQWGMLRSRTGPDVQTGFQVLGDIALVAILVFASGGLTSPFTFLFGLVIIAAGTQARPLLPVVVAVAACAFYLTVVYGFAWRTHHSLSAHEALSVLLQVSALLLAGGVMGGLARRQQTLIREGARARRMHRRLEALHGRVMDALHDGVLALDAGGRIVDGNRAARSMLGWDDDIIGRPLTAVMQVPDALRSFLNGDGDGVCRCEWRRGDRTWLLGVARMPETDADATWLLTAADVTELRALERKLAERERLASLGRMAAMLAHEIRNPLQSIGQAVEMLTTAEPRQRREVGGILLEEVRRLDRLVSGMLDYARPMHPRPAWVHVRSLLETSVAQACAVADGVASIDIRCEADARAWLDADHLRLVLDNLLRNAMQAGGGRGRIEVVFRMAENGQWALRVQDDAGGVPDRVRDSLFEPFSSARAGGSGLGLATVWQVCRANGWEVQADNVTLADGMVGAVFTVCGGVGEGVDGDDFAG